MSLIILSGSANDPLAVAIIRHLRIALGDCEVEPFPDGELHVVIQSSG